MIYTLVALAESNSISVVRNGGVEHPLGRVERTPSISSVSKFLSDFTLYYDRSAYNVPYKLSNTSRNDSVAAINPALSKNGIRTERSPSCH